MSGDFQADWLALREPADHQARSRVLGQRLQVWCAPRQRLRVLDLGTGTGSNRRFLAPLLPADQHWTLVDHDPALLALASAKASGHESRSIQADLSEWHRFASDPSPDLVTASALLDLVSADWLDSLVAACRERGAAALMVLSYDGQVEWSSPDPLDDAVLAAVNAHQQRDKGLGAALGPAAPGELAGRFRDAGYHVWVESSPWDLGRENVVLAQALVEGWVAAACEQLPESCSGFRAWGGRRCADLAAGRIRVQVGHQDLLALPGPVR
ncbi:class I SAM-dependent methyltransferase [Thioalkalivibrio sp.]|uniref:class I SAM-dependent methyltransferase n=1 Tax=Thioalkalivibrio sp. TaxID=2093813 RepID=UPI0012D5221F|nr:class I SAM-dependent methyltransferase [Thioalkalivibrio sp.]TVP78897.1 MAG: class I SAM-dependent methyltransferase [Thioalkalivibrio sp.]